MIFQLCQVFVVDTLLIMLLYRVCQCYTETIICLGTICNRKRWKIRVLKGAALYLTEDDFSFKNRASSAIFMYSYESQAVTHIENVLIKFTLPVQNIHSPKKGKTGRRLKRNLRVLHCFVIRAHFRDILQSMHTPHSKWSFKVILETKKTFLDLSLLSIEVKCCSHRRRNERQ